MDVHDLSHAHTGHRRVEPRDHHAGTALEFQRRTPVIGGIELGPVVESAAVMDPAELSHIGSLDPRTAVAVSAVMVIMAAAVPAGMVVAVVMVTVGSGIDQLSPQVGFHRLVGVAGGSGTQLDAVLFQRPLGASADAAADEHVDPLTVQKAGQCAVSGSVGSDDLAAKDLSVLHVIYFKFLGVSEMLEHVPVFIGYCDLHLKTPLCVSVLFQDLAVSISYKKDLWYGICYCAEVIPRSSSFFLIAAA